MNIKTEHILILAALGGAAWLVMSALSIKRGAPVAPQVPNAPRTTGPAGTMWDSEATTQYRAQLAAELGQNDFWI